MAKLYTDFEAIDLESFVSENDILKVAEAKEQLEAPQALKPYFDYLEEQIDYGKIRLALAILEKENAEN